MNDKGYTLMELLINLVLSFTVVGVLVTSFWILSSFFVTWSRNALLALDKLNQQAVAHFELTSNPVSGAKQAFSLHQAGPFASTRIPVSGSGFRINPWIIKFPSGDSAAWYISSYTTLDWPKVHEKE
jgi:predicted ferric reductase